MGCTVPISLLACMTDTRAVSSVIADRRVSGDTMPVSLTGRRVVFHPRRARALRVLSTCFVLDCAGDEVLSAGRIERLRNAADGEIVTLSPPAREDHVARIRANQPGDRRSGLVDNRLGPLPEVMDAGWVAELVP
jgi:hypothetical protein